MRRIILFFAAVLLASVGWSQTVTLKFKNGTTQQYNMSELESVNFTDDDNNSGNKGFDASLLVGTWDIVEDVNYYDDGTVNREEGNGHYWVFTSNTLVIHNENDIFNGTVINYTFDGKTITAFNIGIYTVLELTSTSASTLQTDWRFVWCNTKIMRHGKNGQ